MSSAAIIQFAGRLRTNLSLHRSPRGKKGFVIPEIPNALTTCIGAQRAHEVIQMHSLFCFAKTKVERYTLDYDPESNDVNEPGLPPAKTAYLRLRSGGHRCTAAPTSVRLARHEIRVCSPASDCVVQSRLFHQVSVCTEAGIHPRAERRVCSRCSFDRDRTYE
jgi:hypothetical protein